MMFRGTALLLLVLVNNVDGLAIPGPQVATPVARTTAPPQQTRTPPPPVAADRPMPLPFGAVAEEAEVQATEGRIAGTHNQLAGNNWWDRAGQIQTYESITRSTGAFSTYTESQMAPHTPKIDGFEPRRVAGEHNQQATGNWWDRPGQVRSHGDIKGSTGAFATYTESQKAPHSPKNDGFEPRRVAGEHNQQATGNWWDRPGQVRSHGEIKGSTGAFATYTESQKAPHSPKNDGFEPRRVAGEYNQQATGNWWDRPGQVRSHEDIKGSTGAFTTYTESQRAPHAPKDDGFEPRRVAGSHNQQATGNWWDRPGQVRSHEDIKGSTGAFATYTESQRAPHAPKNDGFEPRRVAGEYNQQATGNWWDRPGRINSHDSINSSSGTFASHTDMIRAQQNQ